MSRMGGKCLYMPDLLANHPSGDVNGLNIIPCKNTRGHVRYSMRRHKILIVTNF